MNKEKKKTNMTKSARMVALFDWVGALVTALVVLVLIFTFFFRNVGVEGDSMLPTLHSGDRLLLTDMVDGYHTGDIVVIDRYTQDPLIKRVIAVAGDVVEIAEDGVLSINGVPMYESYVQGTNLRRDMNGVVTVPDGHLFVMGDNRSVSKDSRMKEIGFVTEKDVVGKAIYRLWPLTSFGSIYDNLEASILDENF